MHGVQRGIREVSAQGGWVTVPSAEGAQKVGDMPPQVAFSATNPFIPISQLATGELLVEFRAGGINR